MLSGDRVVYTADPALHERPKSLDRVRVNIPAHIDLRRVPNAPMLVSALLKPADRLYKLYYDAHVRDPHTRRRPVLVRTKNYINHPKPDGYRSIHLIMRYQTDSESKQLFHAEDIEIQLRSKQQHIWATAVETAQTFTGQALKSKIKRANADWLRFFALVSSLFAMREKRPLVPGTSRDRDTIIDELREIQQTQRIIECLEGWDVAVHHEEELEKPEVHLFLLLLDAARRTLRIAPFRSLEQSIAEERFHQLESETANDPQKNVVLVSVDSLRALRKAYPNYYVDSSDFTRQVREEARL